MIEFLAFVPQKWHWPVQTLIFSTAFTLLAEYSYILHVCVWQTSGQPICRPTKPGLTCYSWERIHVSKWTKYGCESRRVWQAAAGPDDSVAFPTFPSVDNFNPPRHRVEEHEAYCTEKNTAVHTGSAWQWCHKHWIPLNVYYRYVHTTTMWHCSDLQCSRNVDSMDTLHSFRRGQQRFQGHSGHSCGQWTPVRKPTLLRTCKNHSGNLHSNTDWRLKSTLVDKWKKFSFVSSRIINWVLVAKKVYSYILLGSRRTWPIFHKV